MANLKELRNKINGIQSIRKVTSAMKLVAGVKLRQAEQRAFASKPYAEELNRVLASIKRENLRRESVEFLGSSDDETPSFYDLLEGREVVNTEMFIVFASDKGFCGNFNYMLSKEILELIKIRKSRQIKSRIVCIGNKLFQILKHKLSNSFGSAEDFCHLESLPGFYSDVFENSKSLGSEVIKEFNEGVVDKVSLVFTRYHSTMRMQIGELSLIPIQYKENPDVTDTIFEPSTDEVLKNLLPYNLCFQIYQAALESMASEQSSRMSSMDSATKNADDILSALTIKYNRTRQYGITQELVEIVAGAEAIANE